MTPPNDAGPDLDRLHSLLSRWHAGRAAGRAPTADELCPDDPNLRDVLRQRIEAERQYTPSATGPFVPATDTTGPLTSTWSAHSAGLPSIPGYQVVRELGRGGMGVVYEAVQAGLNRPVALKMVLGSERLDERHLIRFLAEAEAVAAVRHSHVVQVFEFGEHQGRPFIAMELCPGSLKDRLAGGRLDPREVAELVRKVALGVQAVHDQQIVHRDLKPGNVLLDPAGEPKVTDFGLAKRGPGTDLTSTNAVMGTPDYMAPEQARGETKFVGPAADVWALGVILYECLTGRRPFAGGDPLTVIRRVVESSPTRPRALNSAVSRDLELVCLKCLEKEPAQRYGSAGALAADLANYLAGRPIVARPLGPIRRAARWVRRNPGRAAGVAAALVLAGVAAGGGSLLRARQLEHQRQDDLVSQLLDGKPADVVVAADQVDRERAMARLRAELDGADQRRAVNAALLIGGDDPIAAEVLTRRALATDPDELLAIQTRFPAGTGPVFRWWGVADDNSRPKSERVRALALLAAADSGNSRWGNQVGFVLDELAGQPPSLIPAWVRLFRGAGPALRAEHEVRLRREADPERLEAFLALLAVHDAAGLADFGGSPPEEVAVPVVAGGALEGMLSRPENAAERWARVRARALALAFTERPGAVWAGLAAGPDPRLRSYLIHELVRAGVPAVALMDRFPDESDPVARQGLLLALGEYDAARVGSEAARFLKLVEPVYLTGSDPGVHAAVAWLARRWGQGERIVELDRTILAGPGDPSAGWEVRPHGGTFTRIFGPVELVTGAPIHDHYRDSKGAERQVRRLIPYIYAIGQTEVTTGNFMDMIRDFRDRPPWAPLALLAGGGVGGTVLGESSRIDRWRPDVPERYFPTPDCPIGLVLPRDAMAYCRWLSEREGFGKDDMCYPSVPEIYAGAPPYDNMIFRPGYRLPTEPEWEYAARAGSRLPYHFGATDTLQDKYAWSARQTFDRSRPVGQLKPNGLGLFDVHGNAFEWCHGSRVRPADEGAEPVTVAWVKPSAAYEDFCLRGGSFARRIDDHRVSYRWGHGSGDYELNGNSGDRGFRLARTLNPGPVVAVENFDRRHEHFSLKLTGEGRYRIGRAVGEVSCEPAAGTLPATVRVRGVVAREQWFGFSVELEGAGEEVFVWRDPVEDLVRVVPMRTAGPGLRLALVPAGKFLQGTDAAALRWNRFGPGEAESPPRAATIASPFAIGATEVTVGQYQQFVRATGHKSAGRWDSPGYPVAPDLPVSAVGPDDARAFCAWLTTTAGGEFRLPTESEWEYACRAGTSTLFPFGDSAAALSRYARTDGDAPSPVGGLRPNAFGLFDMLGNVREFVAADSGGPANVRGGAFRADDATGPDECRPGRRRVSAGVSNRQGFRVVGPAWTPRLRAEVTDHRVGREFFLREYAAFTVEGAGGDVQADPMAGQQPCRLVVTAPAGRPTAYKLALHPKGGPYPTRVAGAFIYPRWMAQYWAWPKGSDHMDENQVTRARAAAPLWTGELLGPAQQVAWRAGQMPLDMPHTHFLAEFATRVEVPAGTYEVSLANAAGARVTVDGKLVLSTWPLGRGDTGLAEIELTAGPHDVRVEAYQWDTELDFRFAIRGLGPH